MRPSSTAAAVRTELAASWAGTSAIITIQPSDAIDLGWHGDQQFDVLG